MNDVKAVIMVKFSIYAPSNTHNLMEGILCVL